MQQQDVARADADHIVVEDSGIDDVRVLLRQYDGVVGELVMVRNRGGSQGALASLISERCRRVWIVGISAEDKQVHGSLPCVQPSVVGGAFVAEVCVGGQRIVVGGKGQGLCAAAPPSAVVPEPDAPC